MRRSPATLAALLLLLLAGVLAGVAAADPAAVAQDERHVEACAAEPPANFSAPAGGDAIGWVPTDPAADGGNATDGDANATDGGESETLGGRTEIDGGAGTTDDARARSDGGATTRSSAATNHTDDGTNGTAGAPEGTWYAEPLDVAPGDGLDGAELEATVARTAARVEALRCRSFERLPPVRVVNRSTLQESQREQLYDRSRAARRFDDARLSVGLFVGEDRNATEARVATRSAAVLAYYDPAVEEIVLVAENASAPRIDEGTLAHELVHALQDQQFDLGRLDSRRLDPALAETGLIEGEASLVETRYGRRCGGDWTGGCLSASAPATDSEANLGLQLLLSQPYNDGPGFVRRAYAEGGWEAVDRLYQRPPNTTWHVMRPAAYGAFEPRTVRVERVTDADGWEPLRPPEGPAVDVLGPATVAAALMAPTFERGTGNVYSQSEVLRDREGPEEDLLGPYRYRLDAVEGWHGDRLAVYEDDRNRTAAVWRTAWLTPSEARTFRQRYVELVGVRGGVTTRSENLYRFPSESDREGAVYVAVEGEEVVVVRAPDVEAVSQVYPDAPSVDDDPDTPAGRTPPVSRPRPGPGGGNGGDAGDELGATGAGAAAIALVLAAVVLARRGGRR